MKASTIAWHLARDNYAKLARFCEQNRNRVETDTHVYTVDGNDYWHQTSYFDNGGWIKAELLHGTKDKSYSVADSYAVVDYELGG